MKPVNKIDKSFNKISDNHFIMRRVQTIEHVFSKEQAENAIKQLKKREELLSAELERIRAERKDIENALKESI